VAKSAPIKRENASQMVYFSKEEIKRDCLTILKVGQILYQSLRFSAKNVSAGSFSKFTLRCHLLLVQKTLGNSLKENCCFPYYWHIEFFGAALAQIFFIVVMHI
jgi:hypothetical protein